MLLRILRSKLHQATITETVVEYEGSITLSREFIEAAEFLPYEEVLCANFENGHRWMTYIIPTDRPGVVGLNGPAALLGKVGDRLVVMAFALMSEQEAEGFLPRVVILGEGNRIEKAT
ncbi:MAG: aspartate 1-decarboxylase [Planctomycetales bacterium 4484_113]|nr:MAG: aspartate 1-decarboxylase [Planctomycetales bacterium 4484_113]